MEHIESYEHTTLGVVTTAIVYNGQTLVPFNEVLSLLGHTRGWRVAKQVRPEDEVPVPRKELGMAGGRPVRYLTLPGFYRAILSSGAPVAESGLEAAVEALIEKELAS